MLSNEAKLGLIMDIYCMQCMALDFILWEWGAGEGAAGSLYVKKP